jgi:CheY-like chemotaxis protein
MKALSVNQLIELAIEHQIPDLDKKLTTLMASVKILGDCVCEALSLKTDMPYLRNSQLLVPIWPSEAEDLASGKQRTVLVCDDDPLQRMLATAALEGRGLNVLEAESAEHCLGIIDSGATIDLLILDIMLPGMSGIDLLKLLQGRNILFPSVTISGVCPREATEQTSTSCGSMMHLSKPVNWASFGQLAKELVSVSASLS